MKRRDAIVRIGQAAAGPWLLSAWPSGWAHGADSSVPPAAKTVAATNTSWPLFRGDSQATGRAVSSLPAELKVSWQFTPPKGAFEATAVIDGDRVFVGSLDGEMFALDLKTGHELWKFPTEGGFKAAAGIHRETLFCGDADGKFYALSASDGKLQWEYETGAEINGGPNFFGEHVLIGSQDATLYCLDMANGSLVWKHTIGDQIRCMPTISDGHAFLAGCDGVLHAVDLQQGQAKVGVPIESPTGCTPAASNSGRLFFGTEGEAVLAVDWKEERIAWTYRDPQKHFPFRSSAAVAEQLAIVGGRDKFVHAIDQQSGKKVWTYPAKSRVDSSPVIVGDRVFVGLGNGRLVALSIAEGKEMWSYEAGGEFIASPAVASNKLVIGNMNGSVYCFGQE